MEVQILSSMLKSRESFQKITEYINPKNYSTEFNLLLKYVKEYYGRDRSAKSVDQEVLKQQIAATLNNDKHVALFTEWLNRAYAAEASGANIEEVILGAKRHEVGIQIAAALSGGNPKTNADALIEEYQTLSSASSLLDLDSEDPVQVIENVDITELFSRRKKGTLLPVYPKSLGARLDGGVEGGDHILIYGLTELGKSALAINMACGFAFSGFLTLYLGNEDKAERMYERIVCNLSNMDRYAVMANPDIAIQKAKDNGLDNIKMIGIHPGSARQIEQLVDKYSPRAIIVDQLRNLATPTKNNKVIQLEEAAVGIRNLCKRKNIAGVSVTQAADSARNRAFLDTGDVDFSNVGIPGTADVMIGFGATEEMMGRNERGISLAKNKVSGNHDQFFVRLSPSVSKVLDI